MKGDIELSNTSGDTSQSKGTNNNNEECEEDDDEMIMMTADSSQYHKVMEFSMEDDYNNDSYYDEIFAFEDDLQQSTTTTTNTRGSRRRRRRMSTAEEERLSILVELKRTRMLVFLLFIVMATIGFYFGFYSKDNYNTNNHHNQPSKSSSSPSKEIQEEIVLEDDLIGYNNNDPSKASHHQGKDVSVPEVILHDSTTKSGGYEPSSEQSPLYSKRVISTHFADTIEPYDANDLPIFWHVPKAGGTFIDDILGNCFSLTEASQEGITIDHHDTDTVSTYYYCYYLKLFPNTHSFFDYIFIYIYNNSYDSLEHTQKQMYVYLYVCSNWRL